MPLNTGALYPATNVISTYVYNMLMSAGTGSVGMASAAAFYQSIVGFILVMTTNFIVKKITFLKKNSVHLISVNYSSPASLIFMKII